MSERTLDLFADDPAGSHLPPRSILYHCRMVGEGTWEQESLLNYVHRIARAHNLRVMDLLVQIVLPKTQINLGSGKFRFSSEYARTVNGCSKYATQISSALEELTGVADLKSSTFLYWKNFFDRKGTGLLHKTRGWCPDCLDESQKNGAPFNFPLLWACACITHCRKHERDLQFKCEACGAHQLPICDSSHYGRCNACNASLTLRSKSPNKERWTHRPDFFAEAIGEMIALGPTAMEIAKPENFTRGLFRVAKSTKHRSVQDLAKTIKIAPQVVTEWARHITQPRFDSFMELCFRLHIKPIDLLRENGGDDPQYIQFYAPSPVFSRRLSKLKPEKLQEIEAEMRMHISSCRVPPTLKALAQKHKTSVGHLRYRIPDVCTDFLARAKEVRAAETQRKLEARLVQAAQIARRLFEQGMHLPRTRIQDALTAENLSIRCPLTRRAAYDEIERLKMNELSRLRASTPCVDGTMQMQEEVAGARLTQGEGKVPENQK